MNYEKKISSKKYPKKETACIMSSKFKDILFPPSSLNKKQEMAELKHIVFGDKINKRAFNGYYKDISASGDGSVIGWVEDNVLLHIEGNGKVIAPTDCRYLFKDMNIESFICYGAFDTREVTDMRAMFDSCKKLTELDLSGFSTEQVTNLGYMSSGCENLAELDLSRFSTGKVTDMRAVFLGCKNLMELDISGFDTGKVTDMTFMFREFKNLMKLDLSGFDIGKVREKTGIFDGCDALPEQYKKAGKH